MTSSPGRKTEVFHLILIKPTHYEDDGYLLQWRRSYIPANSLASLNGIAEDCRDRKVLGDAVDLRILAIDETNHRVRPDKLIAMIRRDNARALIGLVGVQSNQFPRAVDMAGPFLEAALPVCLGGFHASGSLAMLDGTPPEIAAAQAMGISLFIGEVEDGRFDEVLRDAQAGRLKPMYDYRDGPAEPAGCAGAAPVARPGRPDLRLLLELRSRPRLPVPVLVLHHHQRPGARQPLPLGRRPGAP